MGGAPVKDVGVHKQRRVPKLRLGHQGAELGGGVGQAGLVPAVDHVHHRMDALEAVTPQRSDLQSKRAPQGEKKTSGDGENGDTSAHT